MMSLPLEQFEDLIAAHLAGEQVEVPAAQREEFERAVAAHRALRKLLDETEAPTAAATEFRVPPDVSQHYDIERELGRGGMGVVYLARQRSLNRQVALKVLRPGERAFGPTLQRFQEEAQHLARLRHPHIVSIHEVGTADGEPYFTMDYIDGRPLSAEIAHAPLSPTQAVAILKQICAAVQHAHRQGIVHRDLKPANVLLDKLGHVYVTDFGLARDTGQQSTLTQSGELLGTPQYMAPEQARGETSLIGEATDIHALGLLLFEMLTGRSAFESTSPADVLVKVLHDEPPPLRSMDRRIPRDLETICLKMLRKSPADRYANVSALLEDIRRFEAGEALLARRTGLAVRIGRLAQRHWKIATTAVITATVTMAIVPLLLDRSFEELVQWGDEELASGQSDVAAQVYTRALKRASGAQRQVIADRIVRTCRSLDDGKTAVELALRVIDLVPDASFGRHDYLVAQALLARERAKSPTGTVDIWRDKPTAALELVRSRLNLALASGLPERERVEVEETLTAVKLVLSQTKPVTRTVPEYLSTLPAGDEQELTSSLNDGSQPHWNRARAGIALGKELERTGHSEQALAAYQRAYDLARRVYPTYSGVKASIGSQLSRVEQPDAEECQLVRELADSLHRLAPQSAVSPQGQVEFEVVGFTLPPTIGIDLILEFCDPGIDQPDAGLPHQLPRAVPVRQDRPVSIGLLDGKYRLKYRGNHGRWEPDAERTSRLLQIDVDSWPEEIEVHGNTVTLPPARLFLASEVALLAPSNGDALDLSSSEFEWAPVAGAARYQFVMSYSLERPSPMTSYFLTVRTTKPRLRVADLSEFDKRQIRDNLSVGRTGGWQVDAYDHAGHRIGVTLAASRFLVTGALADP